MAIFRREAALRKGVVCLLMCGAAVGPAWSGGTIAGVVRAEEGTGIEDAVVAYTRMPRYVPGGRPGTFRLAPGEIELSSSVRSSADGIFEIVDVPAGQYFLCVRVPAGSFLDCRWLGVTLVNVPEAGAVTGIEIRVRKAVMLRVRIEDPLSLLPPTLSFPDLTVAVVTQSHAIYVLSPGTRDSAGLNLALLVPPDTPLYLQAYSRLVCLVDENGAPVDLPGLYIPFEIPLAAQVKDVLLRVSARKPPTLLYPYPPHPVPPRSRPRPAAPSGTTPTNPE